MSKTAHVPGWLKFFKPKTNFFDLLTEQARMTADGIAALSHWIKSGAGGTCEPVHKLEHEADEQKARVEQALHDNFVTPFDREEIYDISARLDLIINGAKKIVKDLECFNEGEPISRDNRLEEMSDVLVNGSADLYQSIEHLNRNLKKTSELANEARKTETQCAKIYRTALKELYLEGNVKNIVRRKQLFDSMSVIAERTERLAEKILHLSIKLS